MALKILSTFDVYQQNLDTNERFIRDDLKLEIANWAKFRHTIDIGTVAANLHSLGGPISPNVKDAYRELGKSHYEVVTSLGGAKLSLVIAFSAPAIAINGKPRLLTFQKSLKDFYFHIGCVLDNLARLIYILNDPNSAFEMTGGGNPQPIRHRIDWGGLRIRINANARIYSGYSRLIRSKTLNQIIKIRNALTHGWSCPFIEDNGHPFWPLAIRTQRNYHWLFDELPLMQRKYRKWIPIENMTSDDFAFIERFQNRIFAKLIKNVRNFEKAYNLEIR